MFIIFRKMTSGKILASFGVMLLLIQVYCKPLPLEKIERCTFACYFCFPEVRTFNLFRLFLFCILFNVLIWHVDLNILLYQRKKKKSLIKIGLHSWSGFSQFYNDFAVIFEQLYVILYPVQLNILSLFPPVVKLSVTKCFDIRFTFRVHIQQLIP